MTYQDTDFFPILFEENETIHQALDETDSPSNTVSLQEMLCFENESDVENQNNNLQNQNDNSSIFKSQKNYDNQFVTESSQNKDTLLQDDDFASDVNNVLTQIVRERKIPAKFFDFELYFVNGDITSNDPVSYIDAKGREDGNL